MLSTAKGSKHISAILQNCQSKGCWLQFYFCGGEGRAFVSLEEARSASKRTCLMFLLPVHFWAMVLVPRIWALQRLLLLFQPLSYRVNKHSGHYWKQTDPLDLSQDKVGSKGQGLARWRLCRLLEAEQLSLQSLGDRPVSCSWIS